MFQEVVSRDSLEYCVSFSPEDAYPFSQSHLQLRTELIIKKMKISE